MTAALNSRAARRRSIAFVVLLVVSVLLMGLSSNPLVRDVQGGIGFAFRPIQSALDSTASGIASIASAVMEIDRLRLDNEALTAENERLAIEAARLQEIQRENVLLTSLLQFRAGFEYQTVAATVIARESSEFRRVVTLDRGTRDGVEVGDVVVAGGGALVGRISDVGTDAATLVLLTDATSTVIGQLVSTAATGAVVGQLGGVLVMDRVDATERIDLGAEVVTAGIELAGGVRSPYPKGLLIGQVVDVQRDANDVVQTAFLQPASNLDKLEYVLIVTDYEGGLPPIEEQPVPCPTDGTLPGGEQPCVQPTPRPTPSSSVSPAGSATP